MPRRSLRQKISGFVREHSHFRGFTAFERHFEREHRPQLQRTAAQIARELQRIVEPHQQKIMQTENRFFAELDPHEDFWVKEPFSIADKIRRNWESGPDRYTFDTYLTDMEDLIRFRILCNYLVDLDTVVDILKGALPKAGLKIRSKPKDKIRLRPEQRVGGHRAIHFVCVFDGDDRPFLFEIQVMTLLAAAWDKKDHELIYRRKRNGEEVPVEHEMKSFAASELLFVADDYLNVLRKEIQTAREKR